LISGEDTFLLAKRGLFARKLLDSKALLISIENPEIRNLSGIERNASDSKSLTFPGIPTID
jgi:hypothetical protein